jgi:ABC-type transporter Mla MlaB component
LQIELERMLRITTHTEVGLIRFILEGRLIGEWVHELERCWQAMTATQPASSIQIELKDVGFIDEHGQALLARMAAAGAALIAADVQMKAIVEEILATLLPE